MSSLCKVTAFITLLFVIARGDTGTDDSSFVNCVHFNIQDLLSSMQTQINYETSLRLKLDKELTEMTHLYRRMSRDVEKLSKENEQLKQGCAYVMNASCDTVTVNQEHIKNDGMGVIDLITAESRKQENFTREVQTSLDNMKKQIESLTEMMSTVLTSKTHHQTDKPRDCQDILKSNSTSISGVYGIYPDGTCRYSVYCDMTTQGGGWTVIQRRINGELDFDKTWQEYKNGFGALTGEHWLGNDMLHLLTKRSKKLLVRVLGKDSGSLWKYAQYSDMQVSDESSNYTLTFREGSYSGNAGDGLNKNDSAYNHNNMMFSTKDRDNDRRRKKSCAVICNGGWWYNKCYGGLLNGRYKTDYWVSTALQFKSSWMMIK